MLLTIDFLFIQILLIQVACSLISSLFPILVTPFVIIMDILLLETSSPTDRILVLWGVEYEPVLRVKGPIDHFLIYGPGRKAWV